ncbi:MAG: hypothetical protein G01um101430_683 [Parcubacteria group bacterium Gr01-1014_30]|nr:MAG: hypothetical protein G01um101430_683 [Parcubacteria group bacterium Gr01-1014_30]
MTKSFFSSPRITTTFLLLVLLAFLFNLNFDAFRAGAQAPQVVGEGQLGFLPKWVTPTTFPPTATNLSVNQPPFCLVPDPVAFFSWDFSDPDPWDSQSSYQVQVDNNSNFSSPEHDSARISSPSGNYATPQGTLSYNTTYYWQLKVWDQQNNDSGWIADSSFTTPLHRYPSVDFIWGPLGPAQGEEVRFFDRSTCYDADGQCDSWVWAFQDGNPSSSTRQNATTTFGSTGQKTVTIEVNDSDGFSCQAIDTINVRLPLPDWKEILPP